MKELLEMILLQSGADKAGSGHENYLSRRRSVLSV
jgi:hypothetical protein